MSYLIAVDGGHDITTRGKETPYIKELGRRIKENEFNDAVIEFLKEELKRCGFRTIDVSPEKGTDTPLKVRTDRANKAQADIYASIHFNAYDGTFLGANPEGHSIHIYPGSRRGRKLAENIAKYLKKGTEQKYRGIKENNFHVLRETKMPAILSENGFMDNPREALLMLNVDFQKEVAREHAQGICDYFGLKYIKESKPVEKSDSLYRVQVGAFREVDNAKRLEEMLKKDGFNTYLLKSNGLYKVQTGAFSKKSNAENLAKELKGKKYNTYITTKSGSPVSMSEPNKPKTIKVGSKVKIKKGAKTYKGISLANYVYNRVYEVTQVKGNRVVVTYNGTVVAAMNIKDLILV